MEDGSVTTAEKALYVYLWTRPTGWEIRKADLAERFLEGEWTLRRAIAGLTERGYLRTQRLKGADGRIWGSRMRFRPDGDAMLLPAVVMEEYEKPLAVAIGQALPDPEYDRCHHGKLRRSCETCRWNFRALAAADAAGGRLWPSDSKSGR